MCQETKAVETVDGYDGACLVLDNCSKVEIADCKLVCHSKSSDKAPYPNRWGVGGDTGH